MIAAVDQHIADAGVAHFAEGDFLWVGQHASLYRRIMAGTRAHTIVGKCPRGPQFERLLRDYAQTIGGRTNTGQTPRAGVQ